MAEHFDPRLDPWQIDEADFYEIETRDEQIRFLLRYAVLAPSGHNTQPWSFRITDEGVDVYADYTRRLPIADPTDRELLMSVGAAITNLRVAAAHFGFDATVLYNNRPEESVPVATVALRETCCVDDDLRRLFPSVTKRHTNRRGYDPRELEPDAAATLCDFIEQHSETLKFVLPHDRPRAAELVAEADLALMTDEAWRNELAMWVRPNESSAGDGMSADAFGIPGPLSAFGPWLIRSFDMGNVQATHDRTLVERAAGLIAVTADDDRTALIRAGETVEFLLLELTSLGIAYSFLNAPIEVNTIRAELWSLIRAAKPPQLLVRFGYPREILRKPMPRRRIEHVLVP